MAYARGAQAICNGAFTTHGGDSLLPPAPSVTQCYGRDPSLPSFSECKAAGFAFASQSAAAELVRHYAKCATDQLAEPRRNAAAAEVEILLLRRLSELGVDAFLFAACEGSYRFIGHDPGAGNLAMWSFIKYS